MARVFLLSLLLVLVTVAWCDDYPAPPATFEASKYTTFAPKEVKGSRRADINVQFTAADGSSDSVKMIRVDLVGTPYERGYAHGSLLTSEIAEFAGPALDKFVVQEVMNLSFEKVRNTFCDA